MNTKGITILIALALAYTHCIQAQTTAISYQGALSENNARANGLFEMTFVLFDRDTEGVPLAATHSSAPVSNGLFSAMLDFGASLFDGTDYWLEIAVRTNGSGAFRTLSPRQKLTPTPYAITASKLSGTLPPGALAGTYDNVLTLSNPNNQFAGNGAGLFAVNASTLCGQGCDMFWNLLGNADTTPGVNFVGTTDLQPLELKVNGQRALRLEPTTNSPNVIGGFAGNYANSNAVGVTIGGGGTTDRINYLEAAEDRPDRILNPHFGTISGGAGNHIQSGSYATIGGGADNSIANLATIRQTYALSKSTIGGGAANSITDSLASTIAGGEQNSMIGSLDGLLFSTIGGGCGNRISALGSSAFGATIAGGGTNSIRRSSWAAIGGGIGNTIDTESSWATIAGGEHNHIGGGGASRTTIAGGSWNSIGDRAYGATIGGGISNSIVASSISYNSYATIPGGQDNTAGDYAFAAGRRAKALHQGSFVWGDSTDANVESAATNDFSVRASGGVRFFTDPTLTSGVEVSAGGTGWFVISDRNMKENFESVDVKEVLEQVVALPIQRWNMKTQDDSIRHIGPMAQDFHAAFGLGEDERHINSVDADGVALAAIQGLNRKLEEKDAMIQALIRTVAELQKRMDVWEVQRK